MSKGEIVESLGAGKYRIQVLYATEKIAAELARINKGIAELAITVPQKQLVALQAGLAVKDVKLQIDALIPLYQQRPSEAAGRIRTLQVELVKKSADEARAVYDKDLAIMENLSLLKRRNVLEQAPKEKVMDAWCADFTEQLTGIVGIADINDEPGQGALIRPGYSDDAAYSPARDGHLFPNEAQTGSQIYLNYALLPGVQKWRPRYRIGVISKIKNDACTVALDDAFSSAQNLSINATSVLENVPIQYMDCNGDAFEDGDRVLVSFTKVGPLVIGFEKEPESCRLLRFAFEPSLAELAGRNAFTATRKWFGAPF